MKKILLSLLFLNSIVCFSQKNFTTEEFNSITDNGDKWKKDIKIFMYGKYTKEDSLTVINTISEFNELMETIDVELVSHIDSSNSVIYFLSDGEYIKLYPESVSDVRSCIGITFSSFVFKDIVKSNIHIDIVECTKYHCISSTIIHEMFHLLGFHHIAGEKNSILKGHTEVLTEKDREMISLLYKK
jgi:hypothetical protein